MLELCSLWRKQRVSGRCAIDDAEGKDYSADEEEFGLHNLFFFDLAVVVPPDALSLVTSRQGDPLKESEPTVQFPISKMEMSSHTN